MTNEEHCRKEEKSREIEEKIVGNGREGQHRYTSIGEKEETDTKRGERMTKRRREEENGENRRRRRRWWWTVGERKRERERIQKRVEEG